MLVLRALGPAVVAAALLPLAAVRSADRLILRNLDILRDRTVTALDEDGLVLDGPRTGGGTKITWDEIERGRVELDQARFDKLLAELGLPLFRIRQRLKNGDYEAVAEPAEALYARFAERRSQTAYLVCQATMWSRLAAGRREAAVEPYLRCFELLRSRVATGGELPGSRKLPCDAATAMTPELAPVWFDSTAAKAALPAVQQVIRSIARPRPAGAYVYYASLAIAAGQSAEVERVLPLLDSDKGAIGPWTEIVRAEQELAADAPGPALQGLRAQLEALPVECRPTALLVVGQADVRSPDAEKLRDGLLALLTLPAVYAKEHPDLAAAGLYRAAQGLDKLNSAAGAAAVRAELASRYAGTRFANKGP